MHRERRKFLSSNVTPSDPLRAAAKSLAKLGSSSKNRSISALPLASNPSSIFLRLPNPTVFSRRRRATRISASADRFLVLCFVWRMAGKVYASPCTRLLLKNSGLLPLKLCLNPRKALSGSTKARKFSPFGGRDSPHKKHGLLVSYGALKHFEKTAAV